MIKAVSRYNYYSKSCFFTLYCNGEATVFRCFHAGNGEKDHLVIPAAAAANHRVTPIYEKAFVHSPLKSATLPESVSCIDRRAYEDSRKLQNIAVSSDNPFLSTMSGVLFSKETDRLICCPPGFTADAYAIPDTVASVGEFAFNGCPNLTITRTDPT